MSYMSQQLNHYKEQISLRQSNLEKKVRIISQLETELGETAKCISLLRNSIKEKEKLIQEKNEILDQVLKSHSYRLGSFLLKPAKTMKQLTKK